MTTHVASQAPLLRRPLPPSKSSPEKRNVVRRAPKSGNIKKKDDVLVIPDDITVSKQFDLIQRFRQREKEIQHCTKARGPEPFPHREPKKPVVNHYLEFHGKQQSKEPPPFTLDDFTKNCNGGNVLPHGTKTKMVSFHVWDDSQPAPWLSDVDKRVLSGTYVGTSDPLPDIPSRKPWPQQLVESKLSETDISEEEVLNQTVPEHIFKDGIANVLDKFVAKHGDGSHLLIKGAPIPEKTSSPLQAHVKNACRFLTDMLSKFGTQSPVALTPDPELEVMQVPPARTLSITLPSEREGSEDQKKVRSQFVDVPKVELDAKTVAAIKKKGPTGEELTSTDVAIMNCLVHGGTKLDLKANCLDNVKHLSLSLIQTLTHVNLSFNDFLEIPSELFSATQLRSLNMRNNPVSTISTEISSWRKLKILVLSFCYIECLSPSLFDLIELETLDLSYNEIEEVPRQIGKLKNLKELYVDGNKIGGFPRQILTLELRILRCANNFTHKLFWRSTAAPQPQNLGDIAATVFAQHQLHGVYANILTDELKQQLTSDEKCDFCNSALFGKGVSVVKPAVEAFGIKFLPILFVVCSQNCRKHLRKATELDCV